MTRLDALGQCAMYRVLWLLALFFDPGPAESHGRGGRQ